LNAERDKAVADCRNNQYPAKRSNYALRPAHYQCATDDYRGHRIQKVARAKISMAGAQPLTQYDPGQRSAKAARLELLVRTYHVED